MADSENKKAGPPRIALSDYKSARHSLARVLRMYFRKEIDTEHFRNLCYGLNILLAYDKFEKESELEKRLAELENKKGQFVLSVTPQEMDGLDYTPAERDARILELLQKAGYRKTPQADSSPAPDPVPAVSLPVTEPPQPEQPQPRRLKL